MKKSTVEKRRPSRTPPKPASAEPRRKVTTITRSTSMPMKLAASRSWAVARIAAPKRVLNTKRSRPTMRSTASAMRTSAITGVATLPI